MQFPAVDPTVPARFGPMRFRINRGMGNFSLLPVLLMPDAPTREQHGAINGDRSSARDPGLDQIDQMPPQTANLRRQGGWHGFETPFPGAARRETALLTQQ